MDKKCAIKHWLLVDDDWRLVVGGWRLAVGRPSTGQSLGALQAARARARATRYFNGRFTRSSSVPEPQKPNRSAEQIDRTRGGDPLGCGRGLPPAGPSVVSSGGDLDGQPVILHRTMQRRSPPEGLPSRCLDPPPFISVSPSAAGCGGQDMTDPDGITLRSAP